MRFCKGTKLGDSKYKIQDLFFLKMNETTRLQVLSLPYKDTDYRFNIFLPKEKFELEKIVEGLTAEKVQGLLGKLEGTLLNVNIMIRIKV